MHTEFLLSLYENWENKTTAVTTSVIVKIILTLQIHTCCKFHYFYATYNTDKKYKIQSCHRKKN